MVAAIPKARISSQQIDAKAIGGVTKVNQYLYISPLILSHVFASSRETYHSVNSCLELFFNFVSAYCYSLQSRFSDQIPSSCLIP
jgi:hypothetical protein